MGEIIRELAALGLLEMRADPEDGRAKIVTYTEAGREMTRGGLEHILELEQRFADQLGAEDYETARRVLEGIIRILGETEAPIVHEL